MKAAIFKGLAGKALDISTFLGEHSGRLKNGQLIDSRNVRVLSGGALTSMLSARKIDICAPEESLEGIYTFCERHDGEYETQTTPAWIYENICPEEIMQYKACHLADSRIMVKDIGERAKTSAGYRRVIGAFADGENTYVFYDGMYNIIDERRISEFSKVGNGLVYDFFSGEDGEYSGHVNVYCLVQIFLDVIDAYGNIETTLISGRLILLDEITKEKYLHSKLVSTDGVTYKYLTPEYIPSLGENYTVYYDRVYTEIYPTLESGYTGIAVVYAGQKSAVRYRNRAEGESPFASGGEKLMILPDMRLLEYDGENWALSATVCDTMPTFYAAVQYFDRLFGINGDTVYASIMGDCTDFTMAQDNTHETGGWKMVTASPSGFTAITVFDGKVIVFTNDSMMTVRGAELPFTLSYNSASGCVSQDALASLDGSLYFVSPHGVISYSGSTVKNIGEALPRGIDFSMAKLAAVSGTLVLYLGDMEEVWFYEPLSGEWSRGSADVNDAFIAGDCILQYENGGFLPYKLFDGYDDFSFKIALENGGRRRIKSISVTAKIGTASMLALTDTSGERLMSIYDSDGIVTRTFLPRGLFADNGEICFKGYGDCTLYSVRVEYAPLFSVARKIK